MDNPWLDIRNSAGHLLFRYNPYTNEVEFKKGGFVYELIRLDEIRVKCGAVKFEDGHESSVVDMIVIPERKNSNR